MKKKLSAFIILLLIIFINTEIIYSAWIKKAKEKEKTVTPKTAQKLPEGVDFIKATVVDKGKVKLNWEPPSTEGIIALIYRDTQIIDSKEKLTSDRFITNVNALAGEFVDTVTESGKYYYAIVTTKDKVTNKELVEDQNYISIPVNVEVLKLPPPVTNISVKLSDDKKTIIIQWQSVSNVNEYNIFRANEIIDDAKKLESAELIGAVEQGDEKFVDNSLDAPGKYYYAIITVNDAGENTTLIPDKNCTTKPIEIERKEEKKKIEEIKKEEEKPKPEPKPVVKKKTPKPKKPKKRKIVKKRRVNYNAKLEKIIKQFYYSGKYDKSIEELKKIIKSKAPGRVKNKAKLFLGKSYYHTQQYKKALILFIKLEDVYPEEASFWIKQTLRRLR
ncbi:MAG TPA: tetratricopeptide repeat protein [Candidatus Atribacteria bacterium]|nr:tetratricopeptide repeat protein [Candidatus Atribacteria bacterium]